MTIRTALLFPDGNAREAAQYYIDVFGGGDVANFAGDAALTFRLHGLDLVFINGNEHTGRFNESFSFFVEVDGQAEVDRYWDRLIADGGSPVQCGWLTDRFGVKWQIVPQQLAPLMNSDDEAQNERVFQAMLNMVKLDVAALEAAARAG